MAVACTEPINLVGQDSEIVVECILNGTGSQKLSLYWTPDDARAEIDYIRDADVYLEDLTEGGEKLSFSPLNSGPYTLSYIPVAEHRYRLTVLVSGRDPITAITTFPHQAALEYNANTVAEVTDGSYDCGPSKNISHFRIIRGSADATWFIDSRLSDISQAYYLATTYPDIDTFNASGPTVNSLIEKNNQWYTTFTNDGLTLNYTVRSDYWIDFDPITLKETSIVELGGEDPMIHPDLSAAREIADRFLQSAAHYGGIRTHLSEDFQNGQPIPSFSVAFLNYADQYTPSGEDTQLANQMVDQNQSRDLKIISVSDEYDQYLKAVMVEGSYSWETMFERQNKYSNVDGAAGVFGAAVSCELIPVKEWFGINWEHSHLLF